MEDIRVDADALREEIQKQAKESGLVVTAYMPGVNEEDLKSSNNHVCPVVNVEGYASAVTTAFMVNALEITIEQLKSKPMVKLLSEELKLFSTTKTITIDKEKKEDD